MRYLKYTPQGRAMPTPPSTPPPPPCPSFCILQRHILQFTININSETKETTISYKFINFGEIVALAFLFFASVNNNNQPIITLTVWDDNYDTSSIEKVRKKILIFFLWGGVGVLLGNIFWDNITSDKVVVFVFKCIVKKSNNRWRIV